MAGNPNINASSRTFIDPYQRLNYIQQVCMQERSAAQAHHQAQILQQQQYKVLQDQLARKQNSANKKQKKVPAPLTRMDIINGFIKKLN